MDGVGLYDRNKSLESHDTGHLKQNCPKRTMSTHESLKLFLFIFK